MIFINGKINQNQKILITIDKLKQINFRKKFKGIDKLSERWLWVPENNGHYIID